MTRPSQTRSTPAEDAPRPPAYRAVDWGAGVSRYRIPVPPQDGSADVREPGQACVFCGDTRLTDDALAITRQPLCYVCYRAVRRLGTGGFWLGHAYFACGSRELTRACAGPDNTRFALCATCFRARYGEAE